MSSNEYMKKYMLERYRAKRQNAIKTLGGKCVQCGSEKSLEFDHIEAGKKSFDLAKLWSIAEVDFLEELKKCQLLCRTCHKKKTCKDNGLQFAKESHGSLSSYRYCKCELCSKAAREHRIAYRKQKGISPPRVAEHGSASMYGYQKCRCEKCKEGQCNRAKEWRAKQASIV